MLPIDVAQITAQNQPTVAIRRGCAVRLPVAEAVEETAEDAAFAGKGRARCGRVGALAGDGLVVVGAEQVRVDATVTKGVDHPAGPEFVHARKVAFAPEESLNVRQDA